MKRRLQQQRVKKADTGTGDIFKKTVRNLKLLMVKDRRLTVKQRLQKLMVERFLWLATILLLIVMLMLAFYLIPSTVHLENGDFPKTGITPVSCYNNNRGTLICCADKPYSTTQFLNSSRKAFDIHECYKFSEIG